MNVLATETDPQHTSYSRTTWVFLFVLGLIITVCIAIVVVRLSKDEPSSHITRASDTAGQSIAAGDYRQALDQLEKAEPYAQTKDDKIRIYSEIAAMASTTGDIQKALDYYTKKHKLDPGTAPADGYLLGILYERAGHTSKALAAYQDRLAYLQAQPASTDRDIQIDSLKARITDVQEQQ